MSSVYQGQAELLNRAANALGRLPVRGLVTTGGGVDPAAVEAPPNVRVVRWAPHSEVLEEAAVVVTHCGHGTAVKALAAGVPMVCLPQGRDQKDVALRVRRVGAGVIIGRRCGRDALADAVTHVLTMPGYRAAAERFALTLQTERRHYPSGADEVEALLRAPA